MKKDPTLSSVLGCLHSQILNLFFLAFYIFHSESASRNDSSAVFTAKADLEISAPNDSVPHQQGPDEGSKNYTLDHTFAGTNPSVLVDKTKSAGEGSQTAHTVSGTKVDTRSTLMKFHKNWRLSLLLSLVLPPGLLN
ncbi:hypothetical protein Tco_0298403 [Tanacetum coccineum]